MATSLERARFVYTLFRGSLDDPTDIPVWEQMDETLQKAFAFMFECDDVYVERAQRSLQSR